MVNRDEVLHLAERYFDKANGANNKNKINLNDEFQSIGIDSIAFIKLVVDIEETYGFEFDDEMLTFEAVPNLNTLINYVASKVNECNN